MVNVYLWLIQKGYRTIDQVPEVWRADVQKKLNEEASNL